MEDPAEGHTPRTRRTRQRVRRHAVVIGLLAGLAVAPVVDRTPRGQPFDVGGRTARVAGVDEAAARSAEQTAAPRSGRAGTDAARTWGVPEFTHRSAALEEVAHRPVRLRIEALGVDAPVEAFGRDAGGLLDVPTNATTVAWYREGSVPGAAGSAVLAAHVDHDGRRGVFFDLEALAPGDAVHVDFDDRRTLTFDVVRRRRYAKERLPVRGLFTRNGDAVLTLITCGGQFDTTTRRYEANTVVQATLR